jgi:heterodisulfide reductase subunit B
MKPYAYYPGCSLESLATSYHISALAASRALDVDLQEIEDWNCCGSTAYFHADELLAYTLVARNLAKAEKVGLDFVAPCSGCYKNAYFTNAHLKEDPDLADHINYALAADDLHIDGQTKVKHLIEVYVDDVGLEEVKNRVKRPLKGLRVAPYYGCQLVRPRKDGEDVENPHFFEELISAMGAEPVDYGLKTRCCGGSLIITNRNAALEMVFRLLHDAASRDTDVIATICPMCNVNLEVYQRQVNRHYGTEFSIPVMYFTQLLGLALGLEPNQLGIGKELVSMAPQLHALQSEEAAA